jgi:pectate lyase
VNNKRHIGLWVGVGIVIGLGAAALLPRVQARTNKVPAATTVPVVQVTSPPATNVPATRPPTLVPIPERPAFPGAEGFGAMTLGGRGGRVIFVTTLADSGPGSLRECALAEGPRICLFRVAGTIEVESRIDIWNPYLTIAGQSAPGGGITLKNGAGNLQAPMAILTHDVILRYLRLRPGPSSEPSSTVDALTIIHDVDSDHPDEGVYNIIIDHVSLSWSTDEVLNTAQDVYDITIQWSVIAEGLNCSNHTAGCNSKGMLLGSSGAHSISVHHNLFAHNVGRNPMVKLSGTVDVVNNVMHVPAQIAAIVDGEHGPLEGAQSIVANFVGNVVTAPYGDGLVFGANALTENVRLFVQNNFGPYRRQPDQDDGLFVRPNPDGSYPTTTVRAEAPPITTQEPHEAFGQVLANVGATQGLSDNGDYFWRRDSVDDRIITDVSTLKSRILDDPSEVGGWPELDPGTPYRDADADGLADEWEQRYFDSLERGSPLTTADDFDRDGYTDLEEFLNNTDPTAAAA